MTRITDTKRIRKWFGVKDGRVYDSLPLNKKNCQVCSKEMLVADGSEAKYHKCCRKFRNNAQSAWNHIQENHGNI